MDSRLARLFFALPPQSGLQDVERAFQSEQVLLDEKRLSGAPNDLKNRAALRRQIAEKAYHLLIRSARYGGSIELAPDVPIQQPSRTQYDVHTAEQWDDHYQEILRRKVKPVSVEWMFFAIGIGFLIIMLFSKTLANVVAWFLICGLAALLVLVYRWIQQPRIKD